MKHDRLVNVLVRAVKHYHDQYKDTLNLLNTSQNEVALKVNLNFSDHKNSEIEEEENNSLDNEQLITYSKTNLALSLVKLFNECVETSKITDIHTAVEFQEKLIQILDSDLPDNFRLFRDLNIYNQSLVLNKNQQDSIFAFMRNDSPTEPVTDSIDGVEGQNLVKLYRAVGELAESESQADEMVQNLCHLAVKYWKREKPSPQKLAKLGKNVLDQEGELKDHYKDDVEDDTLQISHDSSQDEFDEAMTDRYNFFKEDGDLEGNDTEIVEETDRNSGERDVAVDGNGDKVLVDQAGVKITMKNQ